MFSIIMNVDKFGRHESVFNREMLRGPKGEGFRLTLEGNYDMRGKRVCNLADAVHDGDSVNLKLLHRQVLMFDAKHDTYHAQNKRITNLAPPISESDAINRKYLQREISKLKAELETTIKALSTNEYPSETQRKEVKLVQTKINELHQ